MWKFKEKERLLKEIKDNERIIESQSLKLKELQKKKKKKKEKNMYKFKERDELLKQIEALEKEFEANKHIIANQALEIEKLEDLLGESQTMMMTKNQLVSINPQHVLYLFLERLGMRDEDDEEIRWNVVAMFKGGYTAVLDTIRGKSKAQKELENLSLTLLKHQAPEK